MKINVEMDLPESKVEILKAEAETQGKTIGEVLAEVIDFLDAYEDEGLAEVLERMKETD
jgi:hypothetical protein